MEENPKQFGNYLLPVTVTPKSLLPIEVWSLILEKLKSTPKAVLNCREVCVDFKEEVDRNMIKWVKPCELDPLPTEEIPVVKLPTTNIYNSLQSIAEFENQMGNNGGNPFPTRMLRVHPKCCECTDGCRNCLLGFTNVYLDFPDFSKRFGEHVHVLGITVADLSSIGELEGSLFQNFPNLRQLEIKMTTGMQRWYLNKSSCDWPTDFNFHPLAHLTKVKLQFSGVQGNALIRQILAAYGGQIKSLTLSINLSSASGPSFVEDSLDLLPNLTNLKIRFPLEFREERHVLNFLKNGNWPLKQLTFYERDRIYSRKYYKFKDVMEVISKFSATLEILHLYFANNSFIIFMLNYLTCKGKASPDSPALARYLQLSVKLPRLQEICLPYGCFQKECYALGTSKLCDKFENLKTIHMWDEKLEDPSVHYIIPNYEEELKQTWWPVLSPTSKLEQAIIFSGNQFDDNVVVHKVIHKPTI